LEGDKRQESRAKDAALCGPTPFLLLFEKQGKYGRSLGQRQVARRVLVEINFKV
jgi:hypothetical protein